MQLQDIRGVGPSVIRKLERLGIHTVRDLLYHFPFRYVDRTRSLKVVDIKMVSEETFHCIGTIHHIKKIRLRNRREMSTAQLKDDTGYINATWFNNPYIASQYKEGDQVIFSGVMSKGKFSNPKIKKIHSQEDIDRFATIEAVYPETKGLKSYLINRYIKEVVTHLPANSELLFEPLPKTVRENEGLLPVITGLQFIHFPQNQEELKRARERFAFEEIYKILLLARERKKHIVSIPATPLRVNWAKHKQLLKHVSFELTQSQEQALQEIFTDMEKKVPMHRLLNGDVGSGKTIVAAAAMWQAVHNGTQAILLAPTSVLARQHYETFHNLFQDSGIDIFLETSATHRHIADKQELLAQGELHNQIIIGTHALIHRAELLRNVGLVVIDEQHRFGVAQREFLEYVAHINSEEKTTKVLPHTLSMSATPIPRSMALTFFGDIDVSFLEKPVERKPIITRIIANQEIESQMYEWIRTQISRNEAQVYVVCPLIEESKVIDAKAVTLEFENLKRLYPEFKVELLHGRLSQTKKDEVLSRFKARDFEVLVSTSVIEVGIDNPNATIMIIEGAERFGLAQLHQIRGRVGRSDKQSYCFLKPTQLRSNSRLEFFAGTNDGFKIAEYDLQTRGPGEVYGDIQAGIPDLKIANIMDLELVKRVKKYIV
ncbi:MAG: ATP-dependent DNA helicase RecG [Candidatus Dojkabacteria bacterium]